MLSVVARSVGAASPPTLNLNVLLIGNGSSDPTTAAWQAALSSEGVAYTLATGTGAYGSESVALPALTDGAVGNFNAVVIADSPTAFATGQLTALDAYESSFAVRQIDGYMYPSPALGQSDVSSGALDGTTGQLTADGLAGFPGLKGPVPFDTGTYGYPATVVAGSAFTPWIEDSAGNVLGGVYQHPSTDPQGGVAELALNFDYNASDLQWLLLAPGLIDWVTQGTHLGLYRNYFGQDVDDLFIADNEWSSQYQCTPGATEPPDYTCGTDASGNPVANNPADTPPDVQMSAADVAYVTDWEAQTGITLNLAFNAVGACTAPSTAAQSSANCTGSVTDNGTTYTDPGQAVDTSAPNDQAFVNALLAAKGDFNWITHTWSHEFLGCVVWQPQAVTSVTANAGGGSFAAGAYNYVITAATAYGESEPSLPKTATVAANGSVALTWPDASNGTGTDGTPGPTLAQEEADHTGGTGFWGYNIYRENPGSTTYGLVGQVAENPAGTTATYSYTDTNATVPGEAPGSSDAFPTATNPGIDCSSAPGSWDPATDQAGTTDASIQTEIAWDQAFAAANSIPNYTPAAVVTGEHSGVESPNMAAALAGVGVTTFATDASRQPTAYSLTSGGSTANSAPRYPSNIYYNADNWADELNEYNTLYVAPGVSIGNSDFPSETGKCVASSATTCLTTPATEASLLASETRIMLSHVLANNPRVGYAHQSNLIGPATSGYTLLTLLSSMQSQYNAWTNANAPLVQMTDVTEAQTLGLQNDWAAAQSAGSVKASEQNGVVTVTNSGSAAIKAPTTAPAGTIENGAAFGQPYGGQLSDWVSVPAGGSITLTENLPPTITSANSATSIVGAPFNVTVTSTGEPAPAITETGALPAGITLTDNGNGTATLAGTATAGTGGSYPITITATNTSGTKTQAFTLTNSEAPSITSATTASFVAGMAGTYTVTTTGYPAATITESGALPAGLSLVDNGDGTATVAGTAAAGSAGTYPVNISATNVSGSTATLALTITVTAPSAPTITNGDSAYFTLGQSGSFAVTTTGSPIPAITEDGALPAGLTLTDGGTGTALLSGTPTVTGTTTVTVTVANGISPNATQTLSIIVGQGPVFTSAPTTSFVVGTAGTFTVTTSGSPLPSLGETGALPSGVTFVDNQDGTATLAGTPGAGTAGSYPINLAAVNGTGTTSQAFTLTVGQGPAITSAAGTTFTLGTSGTFSVTTSGTPAPTVTESGALPAGVTFAAGANGTATIAGTPTASGTFTVTLTAANGTSPDATQTFVLTVNKAPAITSAPQASGMVGTAFSFSVATTGAPTPTVSESGALPAGVTFTAGANGTATIAGTPTASGTFTVTLTAANGVAPNATQQFVLTVAPSGAPTITSAATATATTGKAFTFTVTTTGTPTPTVTKTGTLPAGVTFTAGTNGTATIAGTPTASGTFTLTLTAANGTSPNATQQFVLTVAAATAAPTITSAASATGTTGKAFTFTVTTTGTPTPTVTKTGTLPAGVTFTAGTNGTATIAGTPTASGTFTLTLTAANGTSPNATQQFVLTVAASTVAPTITSAASATGTTGKAFTFTVTTTGTPTPTLTKTGTLPAGVTFTAGTNGTATIAGTPTASGTFTLTLTAANGTSPNATQQFVLTVAAATAAPTITSAASATGTTGKAFTFTVTTTGTPTPTVTKTGTLPAGVTFTAGTNGTARISGTPTKGGVFPLTLTAKSSAGTTTQAFTFTVNQAPTFTSAKTASATKGKAFTFAVSTGGFPTPAITASGALPAGLSMTDNLNGTATISGTPSATGKFPITLTAKNSVGTATQALQIRVGS